MPRILDKTKIVGFYMNDNSEEIIDLTENSLNTLDTLSENSKEIFLTDKSDKKINPDLDFYLVETVSDKEINSRKYDKSSIIDSIKQKSWIAPFQRPLITNHNLNGGFFSPDTQVLGRTINSYFLDHNSQRITAQSLRNNPIPDSLLEQILTDARGGTGTSILKVDLNSKGIQNIKDKVMRTFSQGSIYYKAHCNVCNNSYTSSDCNHYIGNKYTIEKEDGKKETRVCIPTFSDREPREISQVQSPANDTSLLYVYNKKENKILDLNSLNDSDLYVSLPTSDSNDEVLDNDQNLLDKDENFKKNDINDKKEKKKESKNSGGKIMDAKDQLLKTTMIDNLEIKMSNNFSDSLTQKAIALVEKAEDFETLQVIADTLKLFISAKTEDFKVNNTVEKTDDEEQKDSVKDENLDNLSKKELIKKLQKTQDQKEEAEKKLNKMNKDSSNKPFAEDDNEEEIIEDKKDNLNKIAENNGIGIFGF